MMELTHDRVRELLDYDSETGFLSWRVRKSLKTIVGERAGSGGEHKRQITIDRRNYAEHRVIWFYVTGEWPPDEIDHRNRNPQDNRLAELRLATRSQNVRNTGRRRDNTSGFKGVTWKPANQKWMAQIRSKETGYKYLGLFDSVEKAHAAYSSAAREHFGEFAKS